MTPRVIEVIVVEITRGQGVEGDPIRPVIQIWSKEGKFIAERDIKCDLPLQVSYNEVWP